VSSSSFYDKKIYIKTIGALTNKSFSFELRGWEIEKFEAIDPTESFASNIKLLINNQQIIQIEASNKQKIITPILEQKKIILKNLGVPQDTRAQVCYLKYKKGDVYVAAALTRARTTRIQPCTSQQSRNTSVRTE